MKSQIFTLLSTPRPQNTDHASEINEIQCQHMQLHDLGDVHVVPVCYRSQYAVLDDFLEIPEYPVNPKLI